MPIEVNGVFVARYLEVTAPLPGDGVVEFDADYVQLLLIPAGVSVKGFRALSGGQPLSYDDDQVASIIVQTLSGTATLEHDDGGPPVGERIMCRSGADASLSTPTRLAWMRPPAATEHRWYAPI